MVPVLLKRDLLLLRGPLWFSVFSVVKPCLLLWRERQFNRWASRGGGGKQERITTESTENHGGPRSENLVSVAEMGGIGVRFDLPFCLLD